MIGAPQVPKTVIRLEDGKTFVVKAKDISEKNLYVKSVTLNGRPYKDFILRHADIMRGGELVFQMCDRPSLP